MLGRKDDITRFMPGVRNVFDRTPRYKIRGGTKRRRVRNLKTYKAIDERIPTGMKLTPWKLDRYKQGAIDRCKPSPELTMLCWMAGMKSTSGLCA